MAFHKLKIHAKIPISNIIVTPKKIQDLFFNMKHIFSSKNKIKFIHDDLPQMLNLILSMDFGRNATTWLFHGSPRLFHHIFLKVPFALILWLDLQEGFGKGNYFKISNLLQELHSLKQEFLRPTPFCSCHVSCTCSLSKYVKNYKQIEYVIYFLKRLNDSYYMDPFPSINKDFSLSIQQHTLL
ncbi:hypothetical protein CR513_43732, partial [Mucuna pruriens]